MHKKQISKLAVDLSCQPSATSCDWTKRIIFLGCKRRFLTLDLHLSDNLQCFYTCQTTGFTFSEYAILHLTSACVPPYFSSSSFSSILDNFFYFFNFPNTIFEFSLAWRCIFVMIQTRVVNFFSLGLSSFFLLSFFNFFFFFFWY